MDNQSSLRQWSWMAHPRGIHPKTRRVLLKFLGATCLLAAPFIAFAAEPNPGIAIGTVISSRPEQNFNGWHYSAGGLYPTLSVANKVTTQVWVCCYSVFKKGDEYLIARTVPVTKSKAGGVITSRVMDTIIVTKRPTEDVFYDCGILWLSPAFNLYDTKTKIIRSILISDDEFVILSWSEPVYGDYCSFGD